MQHGETDGFPTGLSQVLGNYLTPPTVRAIIASIRRSLEREYDPGTPERIRYHLDRTVRMFIKDPRALTDCLQRVGMLLSEPAAPQPSSPKQQQTAPAPPWSPPRGFLRRLVKVLDSYLEPYATHTVLATIKQRFNLEADQLPQHEVESLRQTLRQAVREGIKDTTLRIDCLQKLHRVFQQPEDEQATRHLKVEIIKEVDIVKARQAGRDLCKQLGFSEPLQIQVSTAISELARNICQYAGKGEIECRVLEGGRRGIEIVAQDNGPGIVEVDRILEGDYQSRRGLGMGLRGSRRIMDEFEIDTGPDKGTRVLLRKYVE